ncbi:MAG TPA: hypothetical protein PKD83_11390 [Ignavibacteria bacterium]|nr:hypothetical protein [Ignavibacteria bacterium]
MAKTKLQNVQSLKTKKQRKELSHLHFAMTTKNYMIIGIGIALIVIGYFFMSENSVDGFLPTTVAPILLILGYCVVVPFGILYNDKSEKVELIQEVKLPKTEERTNTLSVSSNVKSN